MAKLGIYEYAHMIHRAWRYRLNTERDEVRFLLSQDLRGKSVIDIGANTGIYSYWMHKKVGPSGMVYGFEPQPEMIDHLQQVKDAFKMRNLQIAPTGLSSSPGSVTLKRDLTHLGGASIEFDLPNANDSITIELTTLDDYFSEIGPGKDAREIAFIKCDVEGHEHEVIAGGLDLIRRDLPIMLIECHDSMATNSSLFTNLTKIGYSAHFFLKGKLTPIEQLDAHRDKLEKVFLNYVFLPPKKR